MKNDLHFTHQREVQYRREVKRYWEETYKREGYKAAHNAGSLEKTIEVAETEIDMFLYPSEEKIKGLLADKNKVPIPTFFESYKVHKPIADYLGALDDKIALEYGCGYMARYAMALSKHFKMVYGVDVSSEAVTAAEKTVEEKGIDNIDLFVNNGVDLDLVDDEEVDFVFSNLVFQHIGNKEVIYQLTKEIARILKPGGVIRAEYSDETDKKDAAHHSPYHGNGFTLTEMEEMYEECGLKIDTYSHDKPFFWVTGVKK